MRNIYAIDVETEPTVETDKPYALEPWRVGQGKARISCFSVAGASGCITHTENIWASVISELSNLEGEYVVCHNALFDVAWMYATIEDYDIIRKIKWVDSSLLSKWLTNTNDRRKEVSHSLINVCNRYIPEHPFMLEFNDVKGQNVTPGEDFDYWVKRNKLDTHMTLEVYLAMWLLLDDSSKNGFLTEQRCIAPIAKGWVKGIPFDLDHVNKLGKKIIAKKESLCKQIGIDVGVLTSPKKKVKLLFTDWDLEPVARTPTGAPSTNHESLMRLHQSTEDPKFDILMAAIKLSTIESKYINGFRKTAEYVGEEVMHGCPRIFSTYTGRMTYSSKTLQKHQVSIACHQISRKAKAVNHSMKAPPGKGIIKVDANSQEVRFMAIMAHEEVMIEAYNNGKDLHAVMTSSITGRDYESIVQGNRSGDKEIVEDRQAGKLLNLSCSYRIGANALKGKFFTTYEKDITQATAMRYLSLYKSTYPGVPRYWLDAIDKARINGYAETITGRRCYIHKFDWQGESSAINHPIQGSGGDHKYATIAMIDKLYPELDLVLDMHDGIYYFCDLDVIEEVTIGIIMATSKPVYEKIWGVELPIRLPFDGQYSTGSFAEFGDEIVL